MNNINYEAAFNHAEFWRKKIAPHLRHITGAMTFQDYLTGMYKSEVSYKTFGLPVPYIFDLKFLDRFQNRCLTFQYNSPEDVAKGGSVISGIYQFSPNLHGMVNLSLWHDETQGKSDGYCTVFFVYEHLEDALKFIDNNLDLVKKEEDKKTVGFNVKNII